MDKFEELKKMMDAQNVRVEELKALYKKLEEINIMIHEKTKECENGDREILKFKIKNGIED